MAKWVAVTGIEIIDAQIPRKSLRGRYSVNSDAAFIDARCLTRMRRRMLKRARAAGYVLESNPRRLHRMWFRAPESESARHE